MINYIELGSGEPLVLIHGLGNTKDLWLRQHKLAEKFRLIIPELRGHGQTIENDNINMYNFAEDVIKLLEYLNISTAFFCGLSLGGIVVQEIDRIKPSMVKGLILANTTSYIPVIAYGLIHEAIEHYDKAYFIEEMAKRCIHNQEYLDEAVKSFAIRDSYILSALAPINVNYLFHFLLINKPILLIGGLEDEVTPPINILTMKVWNFRAEMIIFNNCGHLSNIEKSEEFNKNIEKFIDRHTK